MPKQDDNEKGSLVGLIHDMTAHAAFSAANPRRRAFGLKGIGKQQREDIVHQRDSISRATYRQRQSIGAAPLYGKKILCVSIHADSEVEQMAMAMGAHVMPVDTLAQAERTLRESRGEWDMMFIMRDGLMPLDHLVTDLLTLRFSFANLPIVLFSTSFMADDMTKDRSPICDASMSLPMTQGRMKMCVDAAAENSRCRD